MQPQSVYLNGYAQTMSETRKILAGNVKKLMDNSPDLASQGKVHRRGKISQSTVDRILGAETSAQIDTVDKVARAFGVEAWQLLHPDMGISERELRFYALMREEFAKLEGSDKRKPRS